MNANSPKRVFTKARQLIVIAALITVGMFATVAASAAITIVDSLGIATTETKFRASEAGGLSIIFAQFPGPKFTLTQPTTITEIGGFVHSFNNQPIIVEIRPALPNGLPDITTVLASFVLSNDNDPIFVSFESVELNLRLEPGTYFALFAPQPGDSGFLVGTAIGSFVYQSDLIEIGFVNPLGNHGLSEFFGAVRILGVTNVFVDDCDTGVSDVVLPGGTTITDLIESCEDAAFDRGSFVSCVARTTTHLRK